MKKLLSLVLSVILIFGMCITVFAEDEGAVSLTYIDMDNSVDTIAYYDFNNAPEDNRFAFTIGVKKLIKYDYVYVQIDYDNSVFDFMDVVFPIKDGCMISHDETETGIYLKFEFENELSDLPFYQDFYASATVGFCVLNPGKANINATAYGVDLDGNKVELDVEYKNVITEVKDRNNKKYVQLGFGEMLFDANKDTYDSENVASFRIEIWGKYEEVDKFVVHFTADKNILSPNESFYVGDVTLDYQISWIETDVGYDYVVSSWETENFEHILHYSAFNTEQSGKHNLSATAEVVYKNGETENLEVIIDGLSEEVVDINSIMMGDVNLDGEITAADARLALRISVGLESADRIVRAAADMDGDGSVSAADARKILRVSAGLESYG